jgi:hypothetical protein
VAEPGKLVISLDTEIAWGRISDPRRSEFYGLFRGAREAIDRQLDLFDLYKIPVTWALVGRLIEDANDPTSYINDELADYFQGITTDDIYADKLANSGENSFLHYHDLVQEIKSRETAHELGTHTYNHCFFREITDKALIQRDFQAMRSISEKHEFTATSLVFPKNQVDHLEIVAANAINIYRAEDIYWYDKFSRTGLLRKILRQIDLVAPIAASCVQPYTDQFGVHGLPGSIVFRREHRGVKRFIPFEFLALKSIRALNRSARTGGYVHLWWHPFNFAYKPNKHLKQLGKVLDHASRLRDKGELEVLTLGDVAKRLSVQIEYLPGAEVF